MAGSGLVSTYDDKIIGFDTQAAAIGGRLEAKALAAGHDPGMANAVIAGTAAAHELVIVTRNTKHFDLGLLTGTGRGQSSVTVHVDRFCLGGLTRSAACDRVLRWGQAV